ncbi:hypothetical protein ABW20_dc0108337 [Dactylellina cionopaga]|nr:hypothetical protein ABW20_dc0108337 [Dactylellina cionopaga]
MKAPSALLLASLSALLFETVTAAPAAAKKPKTTYTTIPVTTTCVEQITTTVPVTINTSITKKGTYTFNPNVVITVKAVPTKIKTTTFGTTVKDVTITSVYYTTVPVTTPATTTSTTKATTTSTTKATTTSTTKATTTTTKATSTSASSASCTGVEGTGTDDYFNWQIGDYYASVPDAKACSDKCALFDDCYAFEYLPLANVDPTYPQNCWLYAKGFTDNITRESTGLFFYDQSCFASVKGVTPHSYPTDKVCGVVGGSSTQFSRTMLGAQFSGSIDACARYCLSEATCQVYMYSEIEFQDGQNCHIYSGDLGDVSSAGQPVATVHDMRAKNVYRIIFQRECALAA